MSVRRKLSVSQRLALAAPYVWIAAFFSRADVADCENLLVKFGAGAAAL